jgi:hypothetical protein
MIFENEFLMRYQIQEMLRVEKTFEEEGIQDELDAYNPLVPDGTNFKATMMLEYPNEGDRKVALAKLVGVEDKIFLEVEGQPRFYGLADEDLEREEAETPEERAARPQRFGVAGRVPVAHAHQRDAKACWHQTIRTLRSGSPSIWQSMTSPRTTGPTFSGVPE